MARVVAGVGVPHTPLFASTVEVSDPDSETSMLFARVADGLAAAAPDVIVMFDSDHFNTFFLDNFPMISVGVAEATAGPNDGTPGLDPIRLAVPGRFGGHVRDLLVHDQFDVAITRDFTVDHSILVPLKFLDPGNLRPLLPIYINGLLPPLPAAQRCFELGRSVRRAIDSWPDEISVAVVASGSFSLEVGGPRVAPGRIFGVPAPAWADRVGDWLRVGDPDALLAAASPSAIADAGNVGGELLNWIAMLGAVGASRAEFLEVQSEFGHGYGLWRPT